MSMNSREFFALRAGDKIEAKKPKDSIIYKVIDRFGPETGEILVVNLSDPACRSMIHLKWEMMKGVVDSSNVPFDDFNLAECRVTH